MVGTIIGSSMRPRTAADRPEARRQQPIAHSVPDETATAVAANAMIVLWPMLASHAALVNRLIQGASDRPSRGRDRYGVSASESGNTTSIGAIRNTSTIQARAGMIADDQGPDISTPPRRGGADRRRGRG